jgi:hypothetical protein
MSQFMAALCSYYIRLAFQAPEDPGEYPELPGPGWVHIRYSINEPFHCLCLLDDLEPPEPMIVW